MYHFPFWTILPFFFLFYFTYFSRYKFKAKEVDKKIFQTRTGIKEVPKKEVTVPVPFDLPGSKVSTSKKEIEKEHYVFHAKPLPADILDRVVVSKNIFYSYFSL